VANFINGELYGRVTDESVPWAMRFPTDPMAMRLMGIGGGIIPDRDRAIQAAIAERKWDLVRHQVPLRHPSQIYEALGEGLLVGLVLLVAYKLTRKNPLAAGVYGGIFVLGYGTVRFFIEYFRQPDSQFTDADDSVGTVLLGMTMGQVLCSAMILAGLVIVVRRGRSGRVEGAAGEAS
jgi:phosphatidylglycerol:prolipoprotein diacylglycerol transferase